MIKKNFKTIAVNFLSLFLISRLIKGIDYNNDFLVLFWAALALFLLNLLLKPILNLLLMPINFLTLGASRWLVNVFVFFLVSWIIPQFRISGFIFPGLTLAGFVVPIMHLSFFLTLILISFVFEAMVGLLGWLFG